MKSLLQFLGRQDWIRLGIRDRLIRFFYNPDQVDSFEFEIDFFGHKYNGNLNCYIDWSAYFFGAYEKETIYLYRDIVKNKVDPVFLDIGANIGHHSLFMSTCCAQVHSFEPYAKVSDKLKQKISRNQVKNITLHPVGLGAINEELPFYAPQGANTGTGSFISSYSSSNQECGVLKVVDADEYISNLLLINIDLIKIDVEGYEKNVLKGLVNILEKYKPTVVMEFSSATKQSFSGLDELLSMFPKSYKVRQIINNSPRFLLFNSPDYRLVDFDFNTAGGDLIFIPSSDVIPSR